MRRFGSFSHVFFAGLAAGLGVGCQDYTFEARTPVRVEAQKVSSVISTVTPTDILFVVDNSPTMSQEIDELRNNVELFIRELAKSQNDYQVGFITPDVDCNVPLCSVANPGAPCRRCALPGSNLSVCCTKPACEDRDTSGDGVADWTSCDGGRLRSADRVNRIFRRPADDEFSAWVSEVSATLTDLGTAGTGYEAPLEAVRRAVACAVNDPSCPDPAVAALNAGFIRPEAELVIVFITDEDDCSFQDPTTYYLPQTANNAGDQAQHLCSPNECYAYWGRDLDLDQDNIQDWADGLPGANRLDCSGQARQVNPPYPDPVTSYLRTAPGGPPGIIDLLGGDARRVRVSTISGAVQDNTASLGFVARGCAALTSGPDAICGCLAGSTTFYCQVTDATNGIDVATPTTADGDGCQALAGGRLIEFVEALEVERAALGKSGETVIDSICQFDYEQTIQQIVNSVILTTCFGVAEPLGGPCAMQVFLNGKELSNQPAGSTFPGYSWDGVNAPNEICLEGGLTKNVGDEVELFVLDVLPEECTP